MTIELDIASESLVPPDTHEHNKQELIGRIQGMVYNGAFGFAAYFYHENIEHALLRKELDEHFGLPHDDIDAHTVVASGVILSRQLQRLPLSSETKADDSELVIGSYYRIHDASEFDI